MSLKQLPLTIIVAATPNNGIGNAGGLPWPMLRKEMAYFARVTKRVPMPKNTGSRTRRNAIIMGRKTWDSIPPKFRPLKDRTNVVISSQHRENLEGITDDVVVAQDVPAALHALEQHISAGQAPPVGRAFIIGGSRIYDAALNMPQTRSILLTRILKDYNCDTHFPVDLSKASSWVLKSLAELEHFVGEDVPEQPLTESTSGEDVSFEFQLFERE
ncbi:hypothetical protein BAUCODRAFT_64411 [Baudoinia panamericana UAMH 10762]|uniref:Dihydrofolate reductase n=1 Tax=Baudoinia panamericana (strain UAMH 10762) TaxID=717646 RepID=M2MQ31_BAUPA|nr:uncharacterized protein BAUCODRAFT_64411 [Baudoinia panamericana UAMH 10762]EMC98881.1 hypothetical protein BAUCODRAFT_64411 [Baudoinia panamericana UAMH 10762]